MNNNEKDNVVGSSLDLQLLPEGETELNAGYEKVVKKKKFNPWFCFYVIDWLVCLIVIPLVFGISYLAIVPYHRYLEPEWYNYPLVHASFPSWTLILVGVIPVLLILIFQIKCRSLKDVHHGLLSLLVSFTVTSLFVEFIKVFAGEYRPNYKEFCDPDATGKCLHNTSIHDRSFPSGHSAYSFVFMTFTSFYLIGKLKIFNRNGGVNLLKASLAIIPFFLCVIIAVSRTRDYYHHFVDITTGSILGFVGTIFGYFNYYPLFFDNEHCDIPKDRYLKYHNVKDRKATEILGEILIKL